MNCLYCGAEITKRKEQKFCNKEHYLAYKEQKRNVIKSYCLTCGKGLSLSKKGKIRKYCSPECQGKKIHNERFKYTVCQYCGETFKEKRNSLNMYCSCKCVGLAQKMLRITQNEFIDKYKILDTEHNQKLLEEYQNLLKQAEDLRYRIEHEKICVSCGSLFIASSLNQKCCSPECSKRYDNQKRDKRIYKNGKPDLSISLTKLYMRDGGICQLCGKHIDFDCDCNSDDYPSIDHILPIAKGGLHQWDNIQLACRGCNNLKGTHYAPA